MRPVKVLFDFDDAGNARATAFINVIADTTGEDVDAALVENIPDYHPDYRVKTVLGPVLDKQILRALQYEAYIQNRPWSDDGPLILTAGPITPTDIMQSLDDSVSVGAFERLLAGDSDSTLTAVHRAAAEARKGRLAEMYQRKFEALQAAGREAKRVKDLLAAARTRDLPAPAAGGRRFYRRRRG